MKRAVAMPFQRAGVRAIENAPTPGRTLLADDQGLGKTLQALWWLRRNPATLPAVVVCPASVKYDWQHAAWVHTGLRAEVLNGTRPPRPGKALATARLWVLNYDILQYWLPWLQAHNPQTVIIDECQNICNPATIRTRAAMTLAAGAPYALAMSGTPLMNRPVELFPTLNLLWPDRFPSLFNFANEYARPRIRYGKWEYTGARNLAGLHAELVAAGMIRRRKDEVLHEFPPKVRRVVHIPLADPAAYAEANDDFRGWIKRHYPRRARRALKAEAVTRLIYLLQLVGRLKLRGCVAWADEHLAAGDGKLIVFCHHRKAVAALGRRYPAAAVVHGGVTGRARYDATQRFQHDPKCRVFIGNKAATTGITLTAADTVAFFEMFWRPADHVQAEDRAYRIGQTRPVWAYYLVAGGTIEERMCELIQEKQEVLTATLDGEGAGEELNILDLLLEELARG